MKLFFTLCLLAVTMCAFAQQKKVAVYVKGNDTGINKVLESKLVSAIARSEEFSAVERTNAFLAELSKEQNYQRTGVVDDTEISRLGKQFGVQYVCVADVTDIYGEKYVSARLIDVETAEVADAYDSGGQISSLNSCIQMANEIARKLLHEEPIFEISEEKPEFPGGDAAMMKYLSENIKYPVIAQENGFQGRVICQFVVNKDGSIANIKVIRSSGDSSLDEEAIRVIKSMPKWKPGMQRGNPVRVKFTLPVSFRLT